jgi:hypothetical protein
MEQMIDVAIAELVNRGVARIPRWAMYKAYNAERLAAKTWRDIKRRLDAEGGDWQKTRIIETDGEFVLINESRTVKLADKI